jgi:cytochrome c556
MKSRFLTSVSFLLLAAAIFILSSNGAWADTQLEESMKQMGKAYKELNTDLKQPQDADKAQYVSLAATMKTQAQAGRDFVPKLAQTLPADQRDAMVQGYQKAMDQLMQTIDSLSQALQSGQWADAQKVMATLHQEMADGHKAFRAKH